MDGETGERLPERQPSRVTTYLWAGDFGQRPNAAYAVVGRRHSAEADVLTGDRSHPQTGARGEPRRAVRTRV